MSDSKFCTHCGAPVDADAVFCTNCGAKLDATPTPAPTPTPTPTPTPAAKKPANVAVRLLMTAIIVALAYGGGKLLGGQVAGGGGKAPAATRSVIATVAPATAVPAAAAPTATPKVFDMSASVNAALEGFTQKGWDIDVATDGQVRAAMNNFFCGTGSHSAYAALFMDDNADHGGIYYTNDERALMILGTWDDSDDSDTYIKLRDSDGDIHYVYLTPTSENAFRFDSVDGVAVGLNLQRGTDRKDRLLQLILKLKNGAYD